MCTDEYNIVCSCLKETKIRKQGHAKPEGRAKENVVAETNDAHLFLWRLAHRPCSLSFSFSAKKNRLYNNIKPPSWLDNSTDLHLFKEGIEPKVRLRRWKQDDDEALSFSRRRLISSLSFSTSFSLPLPPGKKKKTSQWEDPECEHGGKWTVLVPKGPNSKATLDTMWLNALLAAVGEQFAEGDEVCGVVVNVRPKQVREYFSPSSLSLSLSLSLSSFSPPPRRPTLSRRPPPTLSRRSPPFSFSPPPSSLLPPPLPSKKTQN